MTIERSRGFLLAKYKCKARFFKQVEIDYQSFKTATVLLNHDWDWLGIIVIYLQIAKTNASSTVLFFREFKLHFCSVNRIEWSRIGGWIAFQNQMFILGTCQVKSCVNLISDKAIQICLKCVRFFCFIFEKLILVNHLRLPIQKKCFFLC